MHNLDENYHKIITLKQRQCLSCIWNFIGDEGCGHETYVDISLVCHDSCFTRILILSRILVIISWDVIIIHVDRLLLFDHLESYLILDVVFSLLCANQLRSSIIPNEFPVFLCIIEKSIIHFLFVSGCDWERHHCVTFTSVFSQRPPFDLESLFFRFLIEKMVIFAAALLWLILEESVPCQIRSSRKVWRKNVCFRELVL